MNDPISDHDRYFAAAHAVQTGVEYEHSHDPSDGSPKHLRVGVNMMNCHHTALVRLLINKGLFTEAEYMKEQADEAERERDRYQERLSQRYGATITLG